jgi:hypothetical protein
LPLLIISKIYMNSSFLSLSIITLPFSYIVHFFAPFSTGHAFYMVVLITVWHTFHSILKSAGIPDSLSTNNPAISHQWLPVQLQLQHNFQQSVFVHQWILWRAERSRNSVRSTPTESASIVACRSDGRGSTGSTQCKIPTNMPLVFEIYMEHS